MYSRRHRNGVFLTGPDHAAELAAVNAQIAEIEAELGQQGTHHPLFGQLSLMLGTGRMIRFELTGQRADLDDGIGDLTAAVAAIAPGEPDRGMAQVGLAQALIDRFQRTDTFADLDLAISTARDASVTIPAGHEHRGAALASLADALQARYQRSENLADLNESISRYQDAIAAVGQAGFGREVILGNYALARRIRYGRLSDPGDLDVAIAAGQEIVAALARDNPVRAEYLANLGIAFVSRFQFSGALADADDAIRALRGALAGLAQASPHRPGVQSNLAIAQIARYRRTRDRADLDAAISASQAAVETFSRQDPRWGGLAGNAGLVLYQRYLLTLEQTDLDAAIAMARRSQAAMPPDHPDHAVLLTQLGAMLHGRYERTADSADLDGAIRAAYEAVDVTPAGHVERANALVNLGVALRSRFWLTGLPSDRDAALTALLRALEVPGTRPSVRARAAIGAGLLAHDPAQAATLLESAIRLLAEVAPKQLTRGDQQHAIGVFAGVASAAASAALADPAVPAQERPAKALALLEAGRAVLLSQALDSRDDLTDLRAEHADLANRFVSARDRLDGPEPEISVPGDPLTSLGRDTADRERQADELASVLTEIRAIDGFERFGLPPSLDELREQAASGPVVAFCTGTGTGTALLLTGEGISALDLPGLTDEAVTNQVNAFHAALGDIDGDDEAAGQLAQRVIQQTLRWLWDTAAGPVLDALGYRTSPAPGQDWPRIWWVPGGKLGLLPLHAAGYHEVPVGRGQIPASVLDRVVSSYTPTVRALRYARQQAGHRDGTGRALVVAMPVTPGQQTLAGVMREAMMVCGVLPGPVVLAEPDEAARAPDNVPTRENVLRYLPACTVAHFACHAASDPSDPSKSMLLLRDYETSPLTVAALATVDHERLELTYLSACSTAFTAATDLADEAIHLTSAFQLAGSRHVIGTLWPANDLIALKVATGFYKALGTEDGGLDTDRAARALHAAVLGIRAAHPDRPSLWGPYLHAGA
jgi:CHAT domain/Tetratricopeptide repeat